MPVKVLQILFAILVLKLTRIECLYENAPVNHNWTRIEKMDNNGIFELQWYLEEDTIVFKAIVNSRGFVALGFTYQNNHGYDIALAWVDDRSAKANILVIFGILLSTCS